MEKFELVSKFTPAGDQPSAISKLLEGLKNGDQAQTLLGVTGSGKTFSLANVIKKLNRPTLVISHNKTLAGQLYSEFKEFFPQNAVEYFVSYYDYYQPESYLPQTDTYIEKDASINDRLDRLRLSATSSLMTRRDVIVVSSVSCIYNLGSPDEYQNLVFFLKTGENILLEDVIKKLLEIQYEREDYDFRRSTFRVKGDTLDIFPSYKEYAVRIEFLDDTIEKISEFDPLTGKKLVSLEMTGIYPAKHFVMGRSKIEDAVKTIKNEMFERIKFFEQKGDIVSAHRIKSRTLYDMEMLLECGYCHGVENYSRILSGRPAGSRPYCLIDYFPADFITIIDESHVTCPQIRGMYFGDRSRKETLVEHGFRLPSCLDNRPLKFNEFETLIGQRIFVSATPSDYEISKAKGRVIEQIIRPTGLLDPEIEVRKIAGQIEDLLKEVKARVKKSERVFVTTLTKRMAEELSEYLSAQGIKVTYLHSEIKTIERAKILNDLRTKKFDCLVGINLLREGLDIPEVSLVVILDADKEGFLRSTTSLIQTIGRCARNINAKVIMYADTMTQSMKNAISESLRRRKIQEVYNRTYKIKPRSIVKEIRDGLAHYFTEDEKLKERLDFYNEEFKIRDIIAQMEKEMYIAAKNLQFEKAARLRDMIEDLKKARNEK